MSRCGFARRLCAVGALGPASLAAKKLAISNDRGPYKDKGLALIAAVTNPSRC